VYDLSSPTHLIDRSPFLYVVPGGSSQNIYLRRAQTYLISDSSRHLFSSNDEQIHLELEGLYEEVVGGKSHHS